MAALAETETAAMALETAATLAVGTALAEVAPEAGLAEPEVASVVHGGAVIVVMTTRVAGEDAPAPDPAPAAAADERTCGCPSEYSETGTGAGLTAEERTWGCPSEYSETGSGVVLTVETTTEDERTCGWPSEYSETGRGLVETVLTEPVTWGCPSEKTETGAPEAATVLVDCAETATRRAAAETRENVFMLIIDLCLNGERA